MAIPKRPVKLIMKEQAGRVSDEAVEAVVEAVEKEIVDIANICKDVAKNANRKTVLGKDVDVALKMKNYK